MKIVTVHRLLFLSAFALLLISPSRSDRLLAVESRSALVSKLVDELPPMSSDTLVSVVLQVSGGIQAEQLIAEMDNAGLVTLHDRRMYGLHRLREIADVHQSALRNELGELEKSGDAAHIRSLWLTNAIAVDLSMAGMQAMAGRDQVVSIAIAPTPNPQLLEPKNVVDYPASKALAPSAGVETNLTFIGADSAWHMGYTGKGRLVCDFQTAIDFNHPALHDNWKGLDGDTAAAAHGFGSIGGTVAGFHGTHTVGIMVGHDDLTGDTVGVAPGARWIAGYWPDFDWAADPDNDPNTTADMPDAISITLAGGNAGCFANALIPGEDVDMVEALGIVVAFAAGNSGPASFSVQGPSDRAKDSLTNFAVGNIDHRDSNIYRSSGRGPTECDSVSIKPNISAPGAYIRSSVPGGYEVHGGTSMAAPHVAGAVAILRQYAPNASASEIKEAMIGGATRRGSPYPNNDYGWGILNIPGAIHFLDSQQAPDFRVPEFSYAHVPLGDTVSFALRLTNYGHSTDSVFARIPARIPGASILDDSVYFGRMNLLDTSTAASPIRLIFDDTLQDGSGVTVPFVLYGTNGPPDTVRVVVRAGIEGPRMAYVHRNGCLQLSVTNYGRLGEMISDSGQSCGFCYDGTAINDIHEYSLVLAADSDQVSDDLRNVHSNPDEDYWIGDTNGIAVQEYRNRVETITAYNDQRAEKPIGIKVLQRTISWSDSGECDFVIVEYRLINETPHDIPSLSAGVGVSWGTGRHIHFLQESRMAFVAGMNDVICRGVTLLSPGAVGSYVAIKACPDCYGDLRERDKYGAMTGGVVDTPTTPYGGSSPWQFLSAPGNVLLAGDTQTISFALLAADSISQLQRLADLARTKWSQVSSHPSELPQIFTLNQNYPNPFNPETRIAFSLSNAAQVRLDVYNILGQQLVTLVDEQLDAGDHQRIWRGIDRHGQKVASGVYFYRLKVDDVSSTRKMILIK